MNVLRNPKVVSKKVGSQWVILESNRKFVRTLNSTAGFIWSITKNPISLQDVVTKVSVHYKTPAVNIQKDIEEFVEEYVREGLLTVA